MDENSRSFTTIIDEVLLSIDELAERIALILERGLVDAMTETNSNANGDMQKSIKSEVIKQSAATYLIQAFFGVGYAVFVSEGTRPHFPPIEPIAKWVVQRNIGANWKQKLPGMTKESQTYSQQVRSIAYAIARSISIRGTKAKHLFDLCMQNAEPEIIKLLKTNQPETAK